MIGQKRVVGLSAGEPGGSAEIVLKEALRGAEAAGARVELVRVADLRLSVGPDTRSDDAAWFWDRLMDSDGLIVSTPIYSRTIPGRLRLLGDKISGPQADAVFTAQLIQMRAEGRRPAVEFEVDERVLRPRVAGFIAVGGSLPARWKSLALPLMHTLTESARIAVVDQVEFAGAGSQASIVLDAGALQRARRLGFAVGDQAGRAFEDARYTGDPGVCPMCHLSVVVLRSDGVECASCGATGTLSINDGKPTVSFPDEGRSTSVITTEEKLDHFREVQRTAEAQSLRRSEIDQIAATYAAWDPRATPRSDGA
ncbi:MAG: NAD(P)H-dependent oxidoreductase [Actinomycetota bacterium]|nr:NAD(P)H-dependent oxidoreductase [Actinomycetota bacterium]